MMDSSKKDWKLLREKLPGWQEVYMDRLNQENIALLKGEGHPSEKFWMLYKRIRNDKRSPGVQAEMRMLDMPYMIAASLNEGIIAFADIRAFSEELQEKVRCITEKRP